MLKSNNFLIQIITLIGIFSAYFNAPIPSGEEIVSQAAGMTTLGILIGIVIPNLVTPIIKIVDSVRDNGWNWGFIQSPNFYTQIVTVITALLDYLHISNALIVGIVINVFNFLYHLIATALTKPKTKVVVSTAVNTADKKEKMGGG